MNLENYQEYGMCIYENDKASSHKYKLGDVVINDENEIGVVIQLHDRGEFRTDMFGNSSDSEVRMATDSEVLKYRPDMLKQNHFTH